MTGIEPLLLHLRALDFGVYQVTLFELHCLGDTFRTPPCQGDTSKLILG